MRIQEPLFDRADQLERKADLVIVIEAEHLKQLKETAQVGDVRETPLVHLVAVRYVTVQAARPVLPKDYVCSQRLLALDSVEKGSLRKLSKWLQATPSCLSVFH